MFIARSLTLLKKICGKNAWKISCDNLALPHFIPEDKTMPTFALQRTRMYITTEKKKK